MLNYLKAFVVKILYDFKFTFSHGKLLCYALTRESFTKSLLHNVLTILLMNVSFS